ncbi:MAG TPA: hypothetical protein DCZ95_12855 [Verrucomicrobia bacterium]|nr:MAG: hypothetical protein A2X46_11805 [Lentisphaerae bacterium GWF2_57_35]HBA84977.1 hypothetical protein [Verrucomicrobiota bacterium]
MQNDDMITGLERKPNLAVLPDQLLLLSRGFSCLFWSIPLGLLLFAMVPQIQVLRYFQMPSFLIGLMTGYWGLILLRKAGPITPHWPALIHRGLAIIFFQLYLAPFIQWWRVMPGVPYYFYNTAAFYLCTTWGLFLVNQLAGEAGRALHQSSFELETHLFRWASLAFMLAPLLGILVMAGYASHQYESPVWLELVRLGQLLPRWVFIPLLLPFTLTMATAWKAKEHGLSALKRSAKLPALSES